jgi:hypothetical protein
MTCKKHVIFHEVVSCYYRKGWKFFYAMLVPVLCRKFFIEDKRRAPQCWVSGSGRIRPPKGFHYQYQSEKVIFFRAFRQNYLKQRHFELLSKSGEFYTFRSDPVLFRGRIRVRSKMDRIRQHWSTGRSLFLGPLFFFHWPWEVESLKFPQNL